MVKKRMEEIVVRILATVNVSQRCSLLDAKRDGNDMESVPPAMNPIAGNRLCRPSLQTLVAIASIRELDSDGSKTSLFQNRAAGVGICVCIMHKRCGSLQVASICPKPRIGSDVPAIHSAEDVFKR